MPLPIIHRQRALSQIGEIRIGGEKSDKAPGKKLETFRLTSQQQEIITTAAGLYGGKPQPWDSPTGPAWQLYTEASALPCMVIVGYSLTRQYELWEGASKRVRVCDGVTEQFTDGSCLCNTEGQDRCDTITRLMVMLPETGTSLGWKLRSKGEIAADELDGAMMVAEKLANGRAFVPATLRLTQRKSVSGGQTKRFQVPVLDFNLMNEVQTRPQLEPGHTPVALIPGSGVSLDEGLALAGAKRKTSNGRQAAPLPEEDDVPFGDAPVPVDDPEADRVTAAKEEHERNKRTAAQTKKLNVLVGQLREARAITTGDLYKSVRRARGIPDEEAHEWVAELGGIDFAGEIHWAALRDDLDKAEASAMIDWLESLQQNEGV